MKARESKRNPNKQLGERFFNINTIGCGWGLDDDEKRNREGETIRVCWMISGFHCKKILSNENNKQLLKDEANE